MYLTLPIGLKTFSTFYLRGEGCFFFIIFSMMSLTLVLDLNSMMRRFTRKNVQARRTGAKEDTRMALQAEQTACSISKSKIKAIVKTRAISFLAHRESKRFASCGMQQIYRCFRPGGGWTWFSSCSKLGLLYFGPGLVQVWTEQDFWLLVYSKFSLGLDQVGYLFSTELSTGLHS